MLRHLHSLFKGKNYHFHGGLRLPPHKAMSTAQSATALPLSKNYYLSLRQRDNEWLIPMVEAGQTVLAGEVIAKPSTQRGAYLHAPTSGIIKSIAPGADTSDDKALIIHLVADGKDEFIQPLPPLNLNSAIDAMKKRIIDCGIVGLGGAGFPTHQKLHKEAETLLVNAAECEPYITCDDMQMRQEPVEILKGACLVAKIISAERIILAIEDDKPEAIAVLQTHIKHPDYQHISLQIIKTQYPSGSSKQLIELTLGIKIAANKHALDYGVVCHNTATIKAVYDAIALGRPLIKRYVSITGESLSSPQVRIIRIGTLIKDILELSGNEQPAQNYLIGGPMMGVPQSDYNIGLEKTSNCLLFLPQATEGIETQCIRCSKCSDACPMQLLPQQLYWFGQNNKALQQYRLLDCIECNICTSVCPAHIPLVNKFRVSKANLKEELLQKQQNNLAKKRFESRNARLVREEAERKARMAEKRAALQSKKDKLQEKADQESPFHKFDPSQIETADEKKKKAIERAKLRAAERKKERLKNDQKGSSADKTGTSKDQAALARLKEKSEQRRAERLRKQENKHE